MYFKIHKYIYVNPKKGFGEISDKIRHFMGTQKMLTGL